MNDQHEFRFGQDFDGQHIRYTGSAPDGTVVTGNGLWVYSGCYCTGLLRPQG